MPRMGKDTFVRIRTPGGAGGYIMAPVLTTAQRDDLTGEEGMIIFNSTTDQLEEYDGATWQAAGQIILDTHAALETGVHGVGSNYIAQADQADLVANKIVWDATAYMEINDSGRTASLTWTDLDLTAHTSAKAKFAILQLRVATEAYTDNGALLSIRKNGETPTYTPLIYHPKGTAIAAYFVMEVIVGLDSGQVCEYSIDVTATGTYLSRIFLLGYIE